MQSDYEAGLRGAWNISRSGKDLRDWEAGHRAYLANKDLAARLKEANAESEAERCEEAESSTGSYGAGYSSRDDNSIFLLALPCTILAYFIGSVGGCYLRWAEAPSGGSPQAFYALSAFTSTGVVWAGVSILTFGISLIFKFLNKLEKNATKRKQKYHPSGPNTNISWTYCGIRDCKCDHPKRCPKDTEKCDCGFPKVCFYSDNCKCGFPKVCKDPKHTCERPKLATPGCCKKID